MPPSGNDSAAGAVDGIGPGITGEGLDGRLLFGIGESEGSNGAGTGDPGVPGIDCVEADCVKAELTFGGGVDSPVAVNSDTIFSLRVALSSV